MNILYIIGNGFDLAQGMKTQYANFYPYYLKCKSPNKVVGLLKKEITENIGDWSDMEIALGKFTNKVDSEDEFIEMYFDLSDRLAEYLKQESENAKLSKQSRMVDDLFEPFRYLEPLDQRLYLNHCNKFLGNGNRAVVEVNVVTLNYTDSIERLVGSQHLRNVSMESGSFSLCNICHLHGVLDDTILVGVNDEQQIANNSFQQNQAIKDCLVKPEAIAAMRSDKSILCHGFIKKADIIILYGVSLGATDANLWKAVVDRLASNDHPLLVYFHHSLKVIPRNKKQLLGRKEAEVRELLYQRLGLPKNLQSKDRILVGYNKEIFAPHQES